MSKILKNKGVGICKGGISVGNSNNLQKDVYESWQCVFPAFVLKKLKAFALICIVYRRKRLKSAPLYLKTLEKFVQPAIENFTTFCKKTYLFHGGKCS